MLELLLTIVFVIGVLTVVKSVFNISSNILVWAVICIIIYMGLQYFGLM